MKHLFFWEKLADELIGNFCSRTPKANTSIVGSKVTVRKVTNLDLNNAGEPPSDPNYI